MMRRLSAWPAALRRLTGAVPSHRAASGNTNEAETLLDHWKRLLKQQRHGAEGPALKDDDVRQLLLTALRLRQGKAQSSVPEQLLSVFADCYRLMAPPQRLALFRSLTNTLGVQAHEVDTAAAAWQQLRQHQQQQQQQGASSEAGLSQEEQVLRAAAQLSGAATPLFARLFVPLSQQPCGIKLLVDMRGDLLQAIRDKPSGAAPLRSLADALRGCLAEWFSVGLLQLRQISWDASSAALLEKVAAGEAVHPIASWQDLRARLHPEDRRVFAFFHAAMPEEPLVVLHTALTGQVARSMRQLLPGHRDHQPSGMAHNTSTHSQGAASYAEQSPTDRTWISQHHEQEQHQHHAQELPASEEEHAGKAGALRQPHLQQARLLELDQGQDQEEGPPSVAVFYSISSTQPGLAGVDLGNFLIKQVAQRVQAEFPSVTTLCTLSPLPGFASWLNLQLVRAAQGQAPAVPLLLQSEAQQLGAAAAVAGHVVAPLGHQQHLPAENSRHQQQQQQPQLQVNHQQEQQSQQGQQQGQQQQRAAALLGRAVRGDAWLLSSCLEAAVQPVLLRLAAHYLLRERRRGLALDPVANFHLRNGAAVMQLNWRADVSKLGLQRSLGIMVNYHYELDRVQDNNRAYLVNGRVAAAAAVDALLSEAG